MISQGPEQNRWLNRFSTHSKRKKSLVVNTHFHVQVMKLHLVVKNILLFFTRAGDGDTPRQLKTTAQQAQIFQLPSGENVILEQNLELPDGALENHPNFFTIVVDSSSWLLYTVVVVVFQDRLLKFGIKVVFITGCSNKNAGFWFYYYCFIFHH